MVVVVVWGVLGGKATGAHHRRTGLDVLALPRKGCHKPQPALGSDLGVSQIQTRHVLCLNGSPLRC